MRGPNRVARVRDAFCFWFLVFGARRGRRRLVLFGVTFDRNALRDDGKHEPEPLHRPRALHRELLARVLQSERLKPRLVRQRGLKHPHPVCSRRPLRGRQRRGSSLQRLARSRQAVALVANGALDSRVLGARASQVLGGVPRALRRERGPGSSARSRPPVAVMAHSSLVRDVACARRASSSSARRSQRVRRTHGAHTIGRSGICGVREVGSKVSARGRGGGTGEREC